MWAYREFDFGSRQPSLSRAPFWQAFDEVRQWERTGLMWSNVVRMDYAHPNGMSILNAHEGLRKSIVAQQTRLFLEELEHLQPDVCLFYSGPNYDAFLTAMLEGLEFVTLDKAPQREIALLRHQLLPKKSFRTYHPAYLRRSDRWHLIEALQKLARPF